MDDNGWLAARFEDERAHLTLDNGGIGVSDEVWARPRGSTTSPPWRR